MPDGLLTKVVDRPVTSHLLADAALGATELTVEWSGRFPAGGGTVDVNGTPYPYSAAEDDDDAVQTLELAGGGLTDPATAGDQATLVIGNLLQADRDAYVLMPSGRTIVVNVPHWLLGQLKPGDESDVYADPWPVTLDNMLAEIVDVPGRPVRFDGITVVSPRGYAVYNPAVSAGVPDSVWTLYAPWDVKAMVAGVLYDPVTSRWQVPATGNYLIVAHATWAADPTGRRSIRCVFDSADGSFSSSGIEINVAAGANVIFTTTQVAQPCTLEAGSWVSVQVRQTSGAPLDLVASPDGAKGSFTIVWNGA